MDDNDNITAWTPSACLRFRSERDHNFALLILNRPIRDTSVLEPLWRNAKLRVCADGGANCLYDNFDESSRSKSLPDCICGDLDSIRSEVQSFYESHNVPIMKDPDQYSTDFTKSLRWIANTETPSMLSTSQKKLDLVALGGFGGRVDQSFAAIQQLYVAEQADNPEDKRKIYLLSEESVSFLLCQGKNIVETPMDVFGPTCGLIPVGGASMITTQGLEWDLYNAETVFGGMVSTSNHLARDVIEVSTTMPLLFTVEIRKPN